MQDTSGDANEGPDQGLPLGSGDGTCGLEYVGGPGLMPAEPGGDHGVAADGPLGSAGGFDFLQQRGLIVLQLDDEASLRLCGGLEGFFWQCMASRVTMLCATWSSPSNCCAAGISLDFSAISTCARTRPASTSKACSTWAALRSVKLSKLRLSVLPSIAMTRRVGSVMALHRPAACWRKICSTAWGSRPWRMYRIEVWAGARRQCRPKAAFNRRRCTLMKVTMER